MRLRLRFALWNIGMWLCDRLPGATCWIHGGVINRWVHLVPDHEWERWGWRLHGEIYTSSGVLDLTRRRKL